MKSNAVISEDGLYRYSLSREWDHRKPAINFVMLNPSTANAEKDDATIRRCISFAALWGYGGLIVTNLYAYRSTEPRKLWSVIDPVGPENEKYLILLAHIAKKVVCAWGANAPLERAEDVRRILLATRAGLYTPNVLYCVGKTKNGEPKQPVRLAANTQLVEM